MEPEQIAQKLDWLDEERRKDHATLDALSERLQALETALAGLQKQIKDMAGDLSGATKAAARLNQFDDLLAGQRAEYAKTVEDLDKRIQRRERDTAKRRQAELDGINQSIAEMRATLDKLDLRKVLQVRADEDARLAGAISDLKAQVEMAVRNNEEVMRTLHSAEELRKQDAKRLADLQGEVAAVRKRSDEHRERIDVNGDSLRFLETRISELLNLEGERKSSQAAYIEQLNLAQVERERAWREMRDKFEAYRKSTEALDSQLTALDATHRAVKQAQERHDELNQKLERRINEITEVQRLAEDRLRQEWVTFKSDDQKRWTGYTLTQEETMREMRDDVDKLQERLTAIDDATQTLHDQLHQTTDTTEQQLQALMNWSQDWLEAYQRIMGHTRKSR